MVLRVAIGFALLASACGAPPPRASVARTPVPSGASSGESVPIAPPPPAASIAPPPAPVADPVFDVHTVEGVRAFVAALCKRAADGNDTWVTAHAALFLPGNERLKEEKSETLLASRIGQEAPSTIAHTPLCASVPASDAAFSGFTFDGRRAQATVSLPGGPHRLTVEDTPVGPRLAELSFELPPPPTEPKKPPRKEHSIDLRALSSEGDAARPALAVAERNLRDHPICILRHAAKHRESGSFRVSMRKEEGSPLDLRVYASTVVPAPFVSCLEDQLRRELIPLFRGTPFSVEAHLMIGIPTKSAPDDGAVMVLSSERR